jgi:hypothetical protein
MNGRAQILADRCETLACLLHGRRLFRDLYRFGIDASATLHDRLDRTAIVSWCAF